MKKAVVKIRFSESDSIIPKEKPEIIPDTGKCEECGGRNSLHMFISNEEMLCVDGQTRPRPSASDF